MCGKIAKETDVQGVKSYPSVHDIPETELAIISIPSKSCPEVMEVLARQKGVKAFIVISPVRRGDTRRRYLGTTDAGCRE